MMTAFRFPMPASSPLPTPLPDGELNADADWIDTLGSLVAATTHECNNRLGAAILGASTLLDRLDSLRTAFGSEALTKRDLEQMFHVSKQAGSLIRTNLDRAAALQTGLKQLGRGSASASNARLELLGHFRAIAPLLLLPWKHGGHTVVVHGDEMLVAVAPRAASALLAGLVRIACEASLHGRQGGSMQLWIQRAERGIALTFAEDGRSLSAEDIGTTTAGSERGQDATARRVRALAALAKEHFKGALLHWQASPDGGNVFRIDSALDAQ